MSKLRKKQFFLFVAYLVVFMTALGFLYFITRPSIDTNKQGLKAGREITNQSQNQAEPTFLASGSVYENNTFGFSFKKPEGYNIGELDQDEGKTILVQTSQGKGFQILITPFDEPDTVITKAKISTDIPDMKVENFKEVIVGTAKGLYFESDNEVFGGSSAETWFVKGENLYQIIGNKESKAFIEETINSWKWN